ncbi:unnamed protein product [Closterium sp. NIES-54]
MALRPSTALQRVPLPSPPESSLLALPDPESDSLRAPSPTVARFLATAVTDPSFESTAASALVAELVDFAAHCRLDYGASLVAESESVYPPSVGGECALSTDVLEDKQEEFQRFAAALPHLVSLLIAPEGDPDAPDIPTPCSYAEAIEGPYSSQWQSAIDVEMASWKSTGTYVDEVPPPRANIVSGMWIFRVKRPPGSSPVFKARYVARGFTCTRRSGCAAHLASLGRFLLVPSRASGGQSTVSARRPVLQRFDFTYSSPQATPLSTCHSLSALPSDESVEPSGPYPELVGCLMYLMTCTRPDLAYPLSILARYVAPGRHRPEDMAAAKRVLRYLCSMSGMGLVLGGRSLVVLTGHADSSWVDDLATQRLSQGYTFSLGSGSVSWRSARSSSVLSSSCEAEIYAGAMAAQELRWLTYLLTDLGEPPRSPPVLTTRRETLQPNPMYAAIAQSEPSGKDTWFLDSCCGQHMCSSGRFVQREHQLQREVVITVANNQNLRTRRQGVVQLQSRETNVILQMSKVLIAEGLGYNLLSVSQLMAKGIHLEADSTTQEFKLYNGKGGPYIGKAVLKNNVFVLDFVPDLGTADSDGIVTFTSWTHPPDLDPDFSPEGFWYSHTIPETERTRALATIQHSAAAKTTSTAAETTSAAAAETTLAAAETTAAAAATSTPIAGPSTASAQIDDTPPTPAQQLNPTSREVHRSANFTASFYSNSDLYRQDRDPTGGFRGDRAFASAGQEADWDEKNVDEASEEAGPLPYCSVNVPMDDENPRESANADVFYHFVDNGYVTPAEVNTNEAERIGPNFILDPETVVPIGVARNNTVFTGKWVFRVKTKADGTIDKFKARWVVRGIDQEHRRDFTETFAPVSRHTSLQILLAIAAMKKKKPRQIDVAKAFLYAPVDAEIFVKLPHGSHGKPNQVCQLQKSLYGIKQAPRLWQQYLHARLTRIGFRQLPHDQGMYRLTKGTDYILLIVYVDDLLYIGSTNNVTTWFEGELQKDLTLTVSSTVTQYLGLNIQEEEDAIYLKTTKYADTIAKRFSLTPTTISTPHRYTEGNNKEGSAPLKPAGIRDYQRKLGCLLFAAVTCRPDLLYSASQLATYLKKPEIEHMAELDRALHYLVGTSTVGLTYHKNGTKTPKLIGYVDADHAGDSDNRRSRTGYIYRFEPIGPISWQSSKQELIALSSAEAEYIAPCSATKEGLYLRELLEEAKLAQLPSFSLFCDNQSAIRIANKNGFANRTKHIALRYFFVKDEIEKGRLELSYYPTSEMAADYLTKKLGKQKFEYCMLPTGQSHVTSSDTPEAKGSVGNN